MRCEPCIFLCLFSYSRLTYLSYRLLRDIHQGGDGASAALGIQPTRPSGFLADPAALDSCLQLGALVPEEDAGSDSDRGAFVPAGLEIYMVHEQLPSHGLPRTFVKRSARAAAASGSATYRDHVLLGPDGSVVATLDGLEAKQIQVGKAAASAAASKAAQQQHGVLYEVAWLTAAASGTAPSLEGFVLQLATGQSEVAATGSTLAALQTVQEQQVARLQLQTQTAPLADALISSRSSKSGSALWSMLRAYAQEAPSLAYGGVHADGHSALAKTSFMAMPSSATSTPSDGYGIKLQGSTAVQAVLQPSSRLTPALGPYHLMPRPRGAFQNLAAEAVLVNSAAPGWVEVQVKAVGINFRQGLGRAYDLVCMYACWL